MNHKYEFTLSDGTKMAIETNAKYKEALRDAGRIAFEKGVELLTFSQVR